MSRTPDLLKDGEIYVRQASLDDAIAIRSIADSSGIDAWTVEQYEQEFQSERSVVLVAVNKQATVGFILGRTIPGNVAAMEAEIYKIAVADQTRRTGIWRILLARAVEIFASRRSECVWLEVRSSNSAAVQFYENNGFNRSGVRKDFYANPVEDAILMRLDLTGNMPVESE